MSLEQAEQVQGVPSIDERSGPRPAAIKIPIPKYTVIILVLLAAVFAVQLWVDGYRPNSVSDLFFHELLTSARSAGFVKPDFFNGEIWLILTGAFLHGFVAHFALNCYAFYSFGKLFELLTNRAHLAIVFLLSAIGGGLLSAYFMPYGTSIGASGGIVGLIGYLLIYAFRRRAFVSPEFRKNLMLNIGFILLFGFFLYGIVDNWGHIGGLLAGAAYALIQVPADPYKDPREAGAVTETLGLAALGVCIATAAFSIYLMLY
ncbi:MAG: rhomboid family intramembrane serine protease [Pyrinomonadaceae bacterium]